KRLLDFGARPLTPRCGAGAPRLGAGGGRVEWASRSLLRLQQAGLEVPDRLVALALEPFGQLGQPALEPLRTRVADLRESLAEHRLRFADERLDGPVELARQTSCRSFARPADRVGELLRRSVGVTRRRPLE